MQTIEEKLRTELLPLYDELLKDSYEYDRDCIFCMQWGEKFPKNNKEGILFVGRATNGWFDPTEQWYENEVTAQSIFNDNFIFNRPDQMKWVDKKTEAYNSNKSQFWRVIKRIATEFYPADDWFEYIAWSNLCKIAPQNSNPSDNSYYEQLPACKKILQKEIEILSPKYVIFLTGLNWANDFIEQLGETFSIASTETIRWAENYDAKIYDMKDFTSVVTEHPQGKGKQEENHKGIIIEVISRKFKPITDVLKQNFGDNLLITYRPKYIQLYFTGCPDWFELWHYSDKIYLYLCSANEYERKLIGDFEFVRSKENDDRGFLFYISEQVTYFESEKIDKALNRTLIPILKELSTYTD